jgi:hypothetical protein
MTTCATCKMTVHRANEIYRGKVVMQTTMRLQTHKDTQYARFWDRHLRRTTLPKIVGSNLFLSVIRKIRAGSSRGIAKNLLVSAWSHEISAPRFDRHFMKIDAVYAGALVYASVDVIEHACSNENIHRADLAISNSVSEGACAVYNRHTKEHGHKHCWKIHARGTKKRALVGMGKGRELRWTVPIVC